MHFGCCLISSYADEVAAAQANALNGTPTSTANQTTSDSAGSMSSTMSNMGNTMSSAMTSTGKTMSNVWQNYMWQPSVNVWNKWGATGSYWEGKSWRPVISVGEGGTLPFSVGRSQNFAAVQQYGDFFNYTNTSSTSISLLSDAFVGVELNVFPQWALQLGIDYNQPLSFTSNGNVTQGINVLTSQTYAYNYNVVVQQLMGQGKLLYTVANRYHPYLTGGLGVSFNKASGFSVNTSNLVLSRSYEDNTRDSFTYMVGTGVDVDIIDHLRLGVGYRFTDFGVTDLGGASYANAPVTGTLTQSNLYANEFLAQLTWLF